MKFLKKTKSYKIISLLEKIKFEKAYIKIIILIIEYYKFKITNYIQIKRKLSNNKKIELFVKLFEERFYLEQIIRNDNIDYYLSYINYTVNNNIIYANINYNEVILNIEYTINSRDYSIYITAQDKSFNLIDKNLKNKTIYDCFILALKLLYNDILVIITKIITKYLGVFKNV